MVICFSFKAFKGFKSRDYNSAMQFMRYLFDQRKIDVESTKEFKGIL